MLSSRPISLDIDGPAYHNSIAKTPGRAILKGRSGLQENAIHHGARTVNVKGKKPSSQTPFHPTTLQPQRLFKDTSKIQPSVKPTITTTHAPSRLLADKTPFPNRVNTQFSTPLPHSSKFPKLLLYEPAALLHPHDTPDSALRPSSTRKHIRVPRSASRSFETPLNSGNHWDVSDTSIVVQESQVKVEGDGEDYDEIEYMPPSVNNLPYQPPFDFDLPNYKTVGATLLSLTQSYLFDDSPQPDLELNDDELDIATSPSKWDTVPLPELEDDSPFREFKAQPTTIPIKRGAIAVKQAAVIPKPVPIPRTRAPSTASITTLKSGTTTRMISRPGTSASVATTGSRLRPPNDTGTRGQITRTTTATGSATVTGPRTASGPQNSRKTTITRTGTTGKPVVASIVNRPVAAPKSSATTTITAKTNTTSKFVQRPATSASAYKANMAKPALTSRTTLSGKAVAGIGRGKVVAQDSGDDLVLVLGGNRDVGEEEDFRFDV